MDPNVQLMTEIRSEWGPEIAWACQNSSVQPEFLAALIANESGGKADAKRFEPNVLIDLWEVLLQRKTAYGSIGRNDLLLYALPGAIPAISRSDVSGLDSIAAIFAPAFQRIDNLATSWGLTQVMGYHVLENWSGIVRTEDLILPSRALPFTLRMLARFSLKFGLNLATDAAELFDCWNTGEPNGKTADPEYKPRGLSRMGLYAQLPTSPPAAS